MHQNNALFTLAVSGTPCTGKTTASKELGRRLDAVVLDLNKYAVEHTAYGHDARRNTTCVDVKQLETAFSRDYGRSRGRLIVDGLLSHLLPVSHVLVLRADPRLLKKRMLGRGYSNAKIRENLEAEYLGVILYEAVGLHDNILEVDATGGVDYDAVGEWLGAGGKTVIEKDWSVEFMEVLQDGI